MFFLVLLLTTAVYADDCPYKPTPTEKFSYYKQVDVFGRYFMFWNFNDTHVTIEVHAKTHGYVGFGLSPNGRMYPADIVIGWVTDDGVAHFHDRHSEGHYEPAIDQSQDWTLLRAEENAFGTVLKFARKRDTCDPDDVPFTDETMRVIYSFHDDDPKSDTGLPYHGGNNRGSKSVLFLTPPLVPNLPNDIKVIDFNFDHYHLPPNDTVYHCKVVKMPDLGGKKHIVRFGSVLTPGNELHVHHMNFYRCPKRIDDKYVGREYTCYTEVPHPDLNDCVTLFLNWNLGASDFYYPNHVGQPIGDGSDTGYYVVEVHFDNPQMLPNIVDSSGFRVTYTSQLRQYDADMLSVGQDYFRLAAIPPYEKHFVSTGYCTADCMARGLQNSGDEIHFFGVILHAHLLGRKIVLRHIRNGTELEPIIMDNYYDFDFQEARTLRHERTIKRGDDLIIDCHYDSSKKKEMTFHGFTTRDEMCFAFILYYPRQAVSSCGSIPQYDTISTDQTYLRAMFKTADWSNPAMQDFFREKLKKSKIIQGCYGGTLTPKSHLNYIYPLKGFKEYVPPNKTCNAH